LLAFATHQSLRVGTTLDYGADIIQTVQVPRLRSYQQRWRVTSCHQLQ